MDQLALVTRYFYHPATGGSNSLKQVLPAALESSKYLQAKYSRPIYGRGLEIPSLNFENWRWVQLDESGVPIDPYRLLPPIFEEVEEDEIQHLISDENLSDGAAAMVAYARMQFSEMGEGERLALLDRLGLKLYHYAGLDARGYNLGETVQECHTRILNTSMDAAFGADSIEVGCRMKGPSSIKDRYVTEDVPYGLALLSSLGRLLDIPTPISDAIVNLCGAINRVDYWAGGRGVDELGLGGMSVEQIKTFLETGH